MNRSTILFRDGLVFCAVVGAIFFGAVLREVNLLLFFASVLACFLFLDYRLGKKSIGGLTVKRIPPATIHAGEPFIMTVRLENGKKRQASWGVLFEDRVIPLTGRRALGAEELDRKVKQSPGYRPVCYFEKVDAGSEARKSYAGQLPLRGRYQLGPTSVSTRFPLGFFRSSLYFRETSEIIVYPKLGVLSKKWIHEHSQSSNQQNRFRFHASRSSDEILGIRRWQTGDVRKWIHWRATARHNQILVRQFQSRRHLDVAVILDTWLPNAMNRNAFENFELSISFAATVAKEFSKSISGHLYFVTGTKDYIYRGKTGMTFYNTIME
ncbi:MAG: DUF58 domain-containing protein, partial [Planctomycetia bacterium]|nr:DUF58 domain-containing protein [Planctomycetia bacterium]